MKPYFPITTPSCSPIRVLMRVTVLLLALGPCRSALAVGDNNPSGPAGMFNGTIADGVDPYTGNVVRSITDISLAGAVGQYPLALVRTANSRSPSRTEVFGWAGGWNHSYNWIMEDSPHVGPANLRPTHYTVDFPDGRVETFKAVTWDATCYRVRPGADTPAAGTSAGVRERLQPQPAGNGGFAYLILPDGGKIQFQAVQHADQSGQHYYKYTATAIIDPHGLATTLSWETTGNGTRRLVWVTDPSGQRSLHFTYVTVNGPRIASVAAGDGRTVQYNYIYCTGCRLDHVVYYGNSNWIARYQYCNPNVGGFDSNPPLLCTCDDPMYPGPMKRIAYQYKPASPNNFDNSQAVYGQIFREKYYDGNNAGSGVMISQLDIGLPNNNVNNRKESRWDGTWRRFTYNSSGYVTSYTDFYNQAASQGYDTYKYVNYVTDRNNNRTDYTNDPITGNITQIKFPFTHEDTLNQSARPTVNYGYTNNYYLHTAQDEGGHVTTITRDGNNRITEIDYPDGGYERFLSYNAFNQFQTHRMVTGGTETFTYDGRGLKQTYRSPDNAGGNPTARYQYDGYDRVSGITDVLGTSLGDPNHTTSYNYNLRGQLTITTLPKDPVDSTRHTITNSYNESGNNRGDGTLISVTDQLGHVTSYRYDDYRRPRSVTPPVRGGGDNGTHTTWFYYDDNGTADDYKFTDSNVTWVKLPSGKQTHTVYDDNRRKSTITVAPGTADQAMTTCHFDAMGNLTQVLNPLSHNNVTTLYDERNRPYQITVGPSQITNIKYDTAGHKSEIDRPNGQVITLDTFDAMNRVTQQSATNTRLGGTQYIRTKCSYYPSGPAGLLNTFQDPRLFGGTDQYTYYYDPMGRKQSVTYPFDNTNAHATEQWTYDSAGRLYQFTNRSGKVQTFYYDALNRVTSFTWNDGSTPSVSFGYDPASRLVEIDNANATISRTYYNDNRLNSETQNLSAIGGVDNRHVIHSYDGDGNPASLQVPGYTFNYDYTNRNQLKNVKDANNVTLANYAYDARGNLTSRSLDNSTRSDYVTYDVYDRLTLMRHYLNGTNGTRTIQYGYDDTNHSNNRLWTLRTGMGAGSPENNKGEVFTYDLVDQVTAVQLDVVNPNQVSQPQTQAIAYDPNGNRQFTPGIQYGTADDLSQYVTRTINGTQTTASYDRKGNMTTGLDAPAQSTYQYDAQNRLTQATKSGVTISFQYDGLNRQVSRTVSGTPRTYSTWDGWDLVEEYTNSPSLTIQGRYLYGPTGLVKNLTSGNYYYQDGSGGTSHLADGNGYLLEWYRYDLDGTPFFYDAGDNLRSPNQSGLNPPVRHLFTGQQWYKEVALYDLRNRFYSPDLGRFLQPDPIGFRGDGTNIYRYCGNNPVTRRDPLGLIIVTGRDPGSDASIGNISPTGFLPGDFGWPGIPWAIEPFINARLFGSKEIPGVELRLPESPSVQHSAPSSVPQQNPPIPVIDPSHPVTTAEFIAIGNMIEHGNTMDTTPAINPIDLLSGGIAGLLRSSIRSVAARAATKELSVIRYTQQGETFIRYESGNPAFSRITASGGVTAGTYAAPASNSVVPIELRASTYNLPSPDILRSDVIILRPPAGTPIIGPRSVVSGSGDEVIFPFGY